MLILGPGHLCSHYSHHLATLLGREPRPDTSRMITVKAQLILGLHSDVGLGPKHREMLSKPSWGMDPPQGFSRLRPGPARS